MPVIPDIQKSDISIAAKYTQGFEERRCIDALWLIHRFIKDHPDAELRELYSLGNLGSLARDDAPALTVDYRKIDTNAGAFFSGRKKLLALETAGFAITDLQLADPGKPKHRWTKKDILQFRFSYPENPELLLGLKLFATACGKFRGKPFYAGDIRIMFADAPGTYAPPIDEIFRALPEEQRRIAHLIHRKLEALGCRRNVTEYCHPKTRNKPFATIFTHIEFWFFPGVPEGPGLALKLNLRHIGGYADYLAECTEAIRQSVLNTPECSGCKTACGGVRFHDRDRSYAKCPWYVFRFNDVSDQAVVNYLRLIELEDQALRAGRTPITRRSTRPSPAPRR